MVDCKKKPYRGCFEGIQVIKHEMVLGWKKQESLINMIAFSKDFEKIEMKASFEIFLLLNNEKTIRWSLFDEIRLFASKQV